MAIPNRKLARPMPRNSSISGQVDEDSKAETPYADLRQLAGLMKKSSTPDTRVGSLGTPREHGLSLAHRSLNRTPVIPARTPIGGNLSRRFAARQGPPTTPHAMRAHQQRRTAAITPRGRRKSGRMQRETPRDALRNLSRILARNTVPTEPSPLAQELSRPSTHPVLDDLDDDPDFAAPRLSMPLDDAEDDDDDDESFTEGPPRLSVKFEDDDGDTVGSLEGARRAIGEQRQARSSRGSFGSVRLSERYAEEREFDYGGPSDLDMGEMDGDGINDVDEDIDPEGDHDAAEDATSDIEVASDTFAQYAPRPGDPRRRSDTVPPFVFTIPPRTVDTKSPERLNDAAEEQASDISSDDSHDDPPDNLFVEAELPTHQSSVGPGDDHVRGDLKGKKRGRAEKKVSKHGIAYPPFPPRVIKRLSLTYARGTALGRSRLSKEALAAISQASDRFFEQVAGDLADYAQHAGRRRIDEADVIALMRRQRVIDASNTPFSLAQKYLPRELLQEIRMAARTKIKASKKPGLNTIVEVDEGIDEG